MTQGGPCRIKGQGNTGVLAHICHSSMCATCLHGIHWECLPAYEALHKPHSRLSIAAKYKQYRTGLLCRESALRLRRASVLTYASLVIIRAADISEPHCWHLTQDAHCYWVSVIYAIAGHGIPVHAEQGFAAPSELPPWLFECPLGSSSAKGLQAT